MKTFYFYLTIGGLIGMICGSYFDNIHLTVIAGVLTLQGIIAKGDR